MTLRGALVLTTTLCIGCSTLEGDVGDSEVLIGADEELITTSAQSLTGTLPIGSTLKTTANLNLRTGPGTSNSVRLVIPNGATVTTVNTTAPTGGFYNIKYNGTVGWSSGSYLKLVSQGGTSTPSGSLTEKTPAGAVQRAKSGVGATYWWGHGRWFPFSQGGSNAGSCTGSCPNCKHSGSTGADCSGYVAKLWQVPSSNTNLSADSHPYSTATFKVDSSMWRTVSRGAVKVADAFVYNVNGAGHIFLYENGDGWGWMNAYEAKGCSYGIIHNLRTASNSYKAIRHY